MSNHYCSHLGRRLAPQLWTTWIHGTFPPTVSIFVTVALGVSILGCNNQILENPSTGTLSSDLVRDPLTQMEEKVSFGGLLEVVLEAREVQLSVAGTTVVLPTWNGTFLGPTLRIRPGDLLRVHLINSMGSEFTAGRTAFGASRDKEDRRAQAMPDEFITNLQWHGMHISPSELAGNPFISVSSGQEVFYEIRVPLDHPTGVFWYHPQVFGAIAKQRAAGLAGAILVSDADDEVPEIRAAQERVLIVSELRFDVHGRPAADPSAAAQTILTINGQRQPLIEIIQGRLERWRVVSATCDRSLSLSLAGHALHEIGRDGRPFAAPSSATDIVIPPGGRTEFLIQPDATGSFEFRASALETGDAADATSDVLAVVECVAGQGGPRLPGTTGARRSPTGQAAAVRREFTLNDLGDGQYGINHQMYDPARVDLQVEVGTQEEWTIRNETGQNQPFHVHAFGYSVTTTNGVSLSDLIDQDTAIVPTGQSITLRIAFDNFTGRTVIQGGTTQEQDGGMMAILEVVEH